MSWTETLFLKKIIDGKRTLAASDSVMTILPKGESALESQKFTLKKSGSVRLIGILTTKLDSSYSFYILKNGTNIGSLSFVSGSIESLPTDIIVDKDDIVYVTANNSVVKGLKICASVVDASMIKVIEE
jgi:hypothetical protein